MQQLSSMTFDAFSTVDPRTITQQTLVILQDNNVPEARALVCGPGLDRLNWLDRQAWLPEALMLCATQGLSDLDRMAMLSCICPQLRGGSVETTPMAMHICARMGHWGFAFPQWRFLAQRWDGASLLERFGMQDGVWDSEATQQRCAQVAWACTPTDGLGPGYMWRDADWTIVYRRAYVLCARQTKGHTAAIWIRNSAYVFGRDRLQHAAYVTLRPQSDMALHMGHPDRMQSCGVVPWNTWTPTADDVSVADGLLRIQDTLDHLQSWDEALGSWLFGDIELEPRAEKVPQEDSGSPRLHSVVPSSSTHLSALGQADGPAQRTAWMRWLEDRATRGHPSSGPYLGWIDPNLPPWYPVGVIDIQELNRLYAPHTLAMSANAEAPVSNRRILRPVVLSGSRGDHPV